MLIEAIFDRKDYLSFFCLFVFEFTFSIVNIYSSCAKPVVNKLMVFSKQP